MVFGGGMAASYVVNAQLLQLSDTMWILILPLMVSSFNVTIARTFFRTTIPDGIIESAKILGHAPLHVGNGQAGRWILGQVLQVVLHGVQHGLQGVEAAVADIQLRLEPVVPVAEGQEQADSSQHGLGDGQDDPEEHRPLAGPVPIACVYPFFQKYFISGLTVGAVKG